jgi:hypothetical protein
LGWRSRFAPEAVSSLVGHPAGVKYLECDPQVGAHPAAHLDRVDHLDLCRIGDLEDGAADVENHHVLVVVAVDRKLLGGAEMSRWKATASS